MGNINGEHPKLFNIRPEKLLNDILGEMLDLLTTDVGVPANVGLHFN